MLFSKKDGYFAFLTHESDGVAHKEYLIGFTTVTNHLINLSVVECPRITKLSFILQNNIVALKEISK